MLFDPNSTTINKSLKMGIYIAISYGFNPIRYLIDKTVPLINFRLMRGAFLAVSAACLLTLYLIFNLDIIYRTFIGASNTKLIYLSLNFKHLVLK